MSDNTTVFPSPTQIKDWARAQARELLKPSEVFHNLSIEDKQKLYKTTVDEYVRQRENQLGISKPMATDSGADMGYKGYDPAFQGETRAFRELVDSVDFPKFVADLLKAVFDANLKVMKQQTDAYIRLMKEATKSTADFIKKVKDDDAFARLAETRGDKYNVVTEKQPDGTMKLQLTTTEGEKVDKEDAEVKRHLLEAKINMAKEHRAALRDIVVAGVTKMVVSKGEIEAGVEFTIKATRESKSSHQDQNINTVNINMEYDSPLGGLFGGPSGSMDITNTNIQINTADKKATDDLSATLKGKVKIEFKTDYFKLDNFANMYADGGVAALRPPAGGVGPGGAPPAPRA